MIAVESAPEPEPAAVIQPLPKLRPQSVELARQWLKITDPDVRKNILELAQKAAEASRSRRPD